MVYPGFEDIRGWCPAAKAERMEQLAAQAKVCAEIGVFGGQSFFAFGYGSLTCRLIAVDPWRQQEARQRVKPGSELAFDWEQVYQDFLADVDRFGLTLRTTVLRMTSRHALDFVHEDIDVLHIDGNHDEEHAMWDVINWSKKVRPGGTIILDDIDWQSVQPAACWLQANAKTYVAHGTWAEATI